MLPEDVRVLLLEGIHPDAAALLGKHGYEVETLDRSLPERELIARLRGVHVLGIRSGTNVTDRVFDEASSLLAVGAFCAETGQIDRESAARHGVAVFNAPYSSARSVAELVIAELIALNRRLTEKNAGTHAGRWDKSSAGAHEVRNRSVGIVGYGSVGSQVSVLAEILGMSVLFYDTADRLAMGNARRCHSLEELLARADAVTLHVDGRPGNRGLIGAPELALMRPGSLLLDFSPGSAVDHEALSAALTAGHLAGAAIDVPPSAESESEFRSELRGLPNVILTPHTGAFTEESEEDAVRFVSAKLHDFLAGGAGREAAPGRRPGYPRRR